MSRWLLVASVAMFCGTIGAQEDENQLPDTDLMIIERSKVDKLLKYIDLLEKQRDDMKKHYDNCIDGRTT